MSEPQQHPKEQDAKLALEIEKLRLELDALRKPAPSFWKKLLEQWQTTLIAVIVAVIAVFPNHLIEAVKNGLNRADQRLAQFRQLSEDLGEHVFNSEILLEYYENGWTTKEGLTPVVNDYNRSITTLRKREQLYRALMTRYWDDRRLADCERLMGQIKTLDATIHELNPEAELIANGKQSKARPEMVAPILKKARPQVHAVSTNTVEFLKALMK